VGKMSRPKNQQCEENTDLQHSHEMQGVQCQNGIKCLALFGGKGERGVTMPHQPSQRKLQLSNSFNSRWGDEKMR
jgi:hypothetical protein